MQLWNTYPATDIPLMIAFVLRGHGPQSRELKIAGVADFYWYLSIGCFLEPGRRGGLHYIEKGFKRGRQS